MQQLNCVSLLLLLSVLLAALSPVVATAPRELLMAAIGGDQGPDQGRVANTLSDAPVSAVKDTDGVIGSRRKNEGVDCRHFGTRKIPSQVHFSGRIPFTADYHPVHRHPPKHN
ncbi:uncharacterized protein LOC133920673 [Phragmites australis]|uniref:uncharacterized protein LOC133920673 n=1 Tax=Phragmites australis TaxID=29695 RepID=UPI002D767D17|nr:uncharacterized protein LOC133920673 [Phragmites australis]